MQLRQKAQQRAQQRAQQEAAATAPPTGAASAAPAAAAQQANAGGPASSADGSAGSEGVYDPAAAAYITQLAVWQVRYCRQLWCAVSGQLGGVEAGQVLGHHFSEASQVRGARGVPWSAAASA